MIKDKEEIKAAIPAAIIDAKGFKSIACANLQLSPRTFRRWVQEDEDFRAAVNEAVELSREYRDDIAEQKLFKLVEAGDTTATIFYCKTRLKERGYSERMPVPVEDKKRAAEVQDTGERIKKRVTAKKNYIVRLLKKQGKYSPELSVQVTITAQLLVRSEVLSEQITAEGKRTGPGAKAEERLLLETLRQAQYAVRALGMNADCKQAQIGTEALDLILNGDDG